MKDKIIDFLGIVGPMGAGAVSSENDQWTVVFDLIAFSKGSSAPVKEEINVFKDMSASHYASLMNQIEAYDIISFKGREIIEDNRRRIELVTLEKINVQSELFEAYVEEFKKPVFYESKVFGKLVFEPAYDWFTGTVKWINEEITVQLSAMESEVHIAEKAGESIWLNRQEWDRKIAESIVGELLPLKNTEWLDDGEEILEEFTFLSRIKLNSITIYTDDSFEIWMDDGDLFFGHSIQLDGTLSDGIRSATLAG